MRIDVITLFPEMFEKPLETSLLGKARTAGTIEVSVHDLRDHGLGRHRSVDDEPYGGGPGMVMRPEPIWAAVEAVRTEGAFVILMSARGTLLDHDVVRRLAAHDHLVLICGRYEGVDERVAAHLADEEISIGDYVLAGGEVPALVVIEAVSRLVPGVIGKGESHERESFAEEGLLDHP